MDQLNLLKLLMSASSQSKGSASTTSTLPDGCPKVMSYIQANLNDPEELAQVLKSRPELVEQLRIPFQSTLNFRGKNCNVTPLMWVCNLNKTDIARVLIEADKAHWVAPCSLVNQQVKKRFHKTSRFPTALFVAALNRKDTSCFRLLLDNGADVTVLNSKGENIIHHILSTAPDKSNLAKITKRGYDKSDPSNVLNALFNNVQCMQALKEIDALNTVQTVVKGDLSNKPPIVRASMYHYAESVKMLIRMGADIDKQDGQQCTALHWAVSRDDFASMRILLRAGARTDIRGTDNKTAADFASWPITRDIFDDLNKAAQPVKE